jgi:hypothetical protein
VPLGRIRARPRCTVRSAHARGVGSPHAHSAFAARGHAGARSTATRARPALAGPTSANAAHAGAVTAPARASQHSRRRCHSSRDCANGGGRAPTTVRLPVGHGGQHASSPELLVNGEEKKSGSTAASPRRGGATVAGGGLATVRRERRVRRARGGARATLTGRRSRRRRWRQRRGIGLDSGAWRLRTGARGHGWSDGAGERRCRKRRGEDEAALSGRAGALSRQWL